MRRRIPAKRKQDKTPRFVDDGKPRQNDLFTLKWLLSCGFSPANSYSTMTRDRYYPELNDGVTDERLLDFCSQHLKGSPIPSGKDVFSHGKVLLPMFRAAEKEGLVRLKHVPADSFVPELKP